MSVSRISLVLIAAIICLAAPVSANTVTIDEMIAEYVDTSGSYVAYLSSIVGGGGNYDIVGIGLAETELFPELSYLVIDTPGDWGYWRDDKSYMSLGRHEIQYQFGGEYHDGVVYVSRISNLVGAVTTTRYTVFFGDWEIGELAGVQVIELPFIYFNGTTRDCSIQGDTMPVVPMVAGAGPGSRCQMPYNTPAHAITYTWASSLPWKNRISIHSTDMEIPGYQIDLYRRIDGNPYSSTLTITRPDNLTYFTSSRHGIDESHWAPASDVCAVSILSPSGVTYSYPLLSSDPTLPTGGRYQFHIPTIDSSSAYPVLWAGDPFTVTFDCSDTDFADIDFISYTFGDSEYYRTNQQSGDGSWAAYKRTNGNWYQYDESTYEFSIPRTAAQARAHAFPGPIGNDNTYKFLGVARAGIGNEVCDQTTHIRVDGPPVPPDASWTGLRYFVVHAATGDLLMRPAQISIYHPNGTEIVSTSTSSGWDEIRIPRPDPWDPAIRYTITADVADYEQIDDVYIWPFAIYPGYEIAEIKMRSIGAPGDPENGLLQFYIRDQATGRPIPAARINVGGTIKITNNQGSTSLELPGNRTYAYRIEADGYLSVSDDIYLPANNSATVQLSLIHPAEVTPGPTSDPGGLGDRTSHRDATRATLESIYGVVPGFVILVMCMLLLTIVRRGGR